jgi:hypothetical protein
MADFHEGIKEPKPPRRDIWRLPRILDIKSIRRRYSEPLVSYRGLERVEHLEAVEIVVSTDGPFPIRALAPVLYIDDEPVDHWEIEGVNEYRFFAFEPERLKDGAPIALGWPDDRRPREPAKVRFRVDEAAD